MDDSIATWQEYLRRSTDLSSTTIANYSRDVERFAVWLTMYDSRVDHKTITIGDARTYREHLLDQGRAPATINRAMTSLALFYDYLGRAGDNPFRAVDRIEAIEHAPQALDRVSWNAVRRAAERLGQRDHGLSLALVCLMRFAGLRVGEEAMLEGRDLSLSVRRGVVTIRRGKGLKQRSVPLVQDVREPLQEYLAYRNGLAERWRHRAGGQPAPAWSRWPEGCVFLGQRGPLTERGIREIVAKLGQSAQLDKPLNPHMLRHTFATALLNPQAYGIDRSPASLTAVQDLLGHADPATTAIYAKASYDDLAQMMGDD